ncbi:hypothetical protein BDK51DRAFT_42389 [Blyttiomyces helicus]|uniref:Uncharacterized protein n=1 Tax=Blyttiomyces helicus TaxID=388810 RepID=A0A4P9WAC8_9FUNG|nr:hypothetical protein BDK51DRAFT_42389 [Blyttiomyces helicus]|eukprot:RKO88505.1 hypothetical protein BDK51DRAFT_42389 [Blyttiomyces helicus]
MYPALSSLPVMSDVSRSKGDLAPLPVSLCLPANPFLPSPYTIPTSPSARILEAPSPRKGHPSQKKFNMRESVKSEGESPPLVLPECGKEPDLTFPSISRRLGHNEPSPEHDLRPELNDILVPPRRDLEHDELNCVRLPSNIIRKKHAQLGRFMEDIVRKNLDMLTGRLPLSSTSPPCNNPPRFRLTPDPSSIGPLFLLPDFSRKTNMIRDNLGKALTAYEKIADRLSIMSGKVERAAPFLDEVVSLRTRCAELEEQKAKEVQEEVVESD